MDVVGDEAATTVECTVEVNDNYTPITVSATVKITRRPVTLSTSSVNVTMPSDQIATFTEDKIVDATAGQKNKGYVGSEKFTYSNLATNSIPDGQSRPATFDYAANATILLNNYTVSRTYGKLTVQAIPPPHGDCEPVAKDCSIVYQIQFNVYTTKGVALGYSTGSQCAPGSTCVVMRGRDKTVLRGYVYLCGCGCDVTQYNDVFCDSRRHALFDSSSNSLTWKCAHVMGSNLTDAECAWTFSNTVAYDASRESKYDLAGSGYGTYNGEFFTSFSGYFAGWVDKTFDLTTKAGTATPGSCLCDPSQVVYCSDLSTWALDAEEASVAFGKWKMKFNANISKAYIAGKWSPLAAIKKAMK